MAIRFDPLLPPAIIFAAIIVFGFLIFVKYRRYRPVTSWSYWRLLLGVKILSLLLLTVLWANPHLVKKTPDTDKLDIVFLIDATDSMTTGDAKKGTRLEFVKDEVLEPSSVFHHQLVSKYGNAHFFLFSGEELRRFQAGTEFDTLPGETDIDLILGKVLAQSTDQRALGAVVLISDGIDNKGVSLMAAAKKYKNENIPIHCIGVGDPYPRADLGVAWNDVPEESPKNEKLTMSATVTRDNSEDKVVQVNLFEDNRLIDTQEVAFDGNATEKDVVFQFTPFTSGLKSYKIQLDALAKEENQLNNIDFAGIRIKDPDVFRTLFFSSNLDWDYKFLNIWADDEEKLTLDAVIRLSDESYFVRGFEDKKRKLTAYLNVRS